jgi:hypothetical protein
VRSAIDHLDGRDVRGRDRLFATGNMPLDDLVEIEMPPQPEARPDVAERSRIGSSHGFQVDPHDIRIVRQVDVIVVGEEPSVNGS